MDLLPFPAPSDTSSFSPLPEPRPGPPALLFLRGAACVAPLYPRPPFWLLLTRSPAAEPCTCSGDTSKLSKFVAQWAYQVSPLWETGGLQGQGVVEENGGDGDNEGLSLRLQDFCDGVRNQRAAFSLLLSADLTFLCLKWGRQSWQAGVGRGLGPQIVKDLADLFGNGFDHRHCLYRRICDC